MSDYMGLMQFTVWSESPINVEDIISVSMSSEVMDVEMESESEDDVPYVGLMVFTHMWRKQAEKMAKSHRANVNEIIAKFQQVISIKEEYANELAVFLEKRDYPSNMVEEAYALSIRYDDTDVSSINLADYYKKRGEYDKMIPCLRKAIHTYHSSYAAMLLALHHAQNAATATYGGDDDKTQDERTKRVSDVSWYYHLAMKYYDQEPEQIICLDTTVYTFELVSLVDLIIEKGWNRDNPIYREIDRTCRQQDGVTVFRNKVRLFGSLNHVVECGVCLTTGLNIDFACGHCVCRACYLQLLHKPCPYCRTMNS
jgi:hypothetical protein